MKHRHIWLLGSVRPDRNMERATVRYTCRCGKRRAQKTGSALVVETARWREGR